MSAVAMAPLVQLTDDQKNAAAQAATPDLKFLMDREGVNEDIQLVLYHMGVTTVRLFASLATDTQDLAGVIKTGGFGLDPSGDLLMRI